MQLLGHFKHLFVLIYHILIEPMKKPLISIIVPVYNVKMYLRQCLDSILAQTLTDWEAILVDDGSTDGSGDICDEYAAADARIRVIHKENTGQADSRNIALSEAAADYIGFVDSDDWIEPSMYEILYNTMAENDADISMCSYFFDYINKKRAYFDTGQTLVVQGHEAMEEVIEDKRFHSYLWDKLFKKEMIDTPLPKSRYYEDHSTLFKWVANARLVAWKQIPLYHYRQRKGSTDHDGDPLKKYHFFKAEQNRVEYFLDRQIPGNKKRAMEVRLVKTGIQQIKEIARTYKHDGQSMKYINKIRSEISPMLPVKLSEYGLWRYFRLYAVQNHLQFSLKMMRMEKYFTAAHILNNKMYYE